MAEADTRIDPVASDAASGCDIDPSSQHLLDAERPYIDARRLTRDWQTAAPLTALALSGGGIRSAAFALCCHLARTPDGLNFLLLRHHVLF